MKGIGKQKFLQLKKISMINKSNRREKADLTHNLHFFKVDLRRDAHVACVEGGGSFYKL